MLIGPFRTQEGIFSKELQIEIRSPDLSTRIGSPVTVTVGPGIEIVDLSTQVGEAVVDVRYDISDKRIEADFSGLRSGTFGTGDFNGTVFSDVADSIAPILGVTLDPNMNSMGLTADDIQFDCNSIRINLSGKRYTRDSLLAVNVEFASDPANVPFISEGQRTLEVRFSEPLAAGSVAAGFAIEGAGSDEVFGTTDDILVNTTPTLRSNDKVVRIISELAPGAYRLVVDESEVTDRAGNALGNSTFTRTFQVREVAPLFQGENPEIVFVIDVSRSANDPFEGSPVGDINNDGRSNTILDAELASVLLLNQELVSLGLGTAANISIVPFSNSATALDMNPFVDRIQLATNPGADADGNGIGDIEQALRNLTAGGGTDFSDALDVAISTFDQLGTVSGEGNLIFMSDGSGGGGLTSQLQSLRDRNVKIRAFGVGDGADLASLRALDLAAEQFSSTDEFLNAIFGIR